MPDPLDPTQLTPPATGVPPSGTNPPLDPQGGTPPSLPAQQDNQPPAADPSQDYLQYIIPADFTEDMQSRCMGIINREMGRIKKEYDEIDWFKHCEAADDEYTGAHSADPDVDDDSSGNDDIKLLITTVTIDIIASRAYRQSWSPNPAVYLEAEFAGVPDQMDMLVRRMDYLDYCLRNKAKLQDHSLPLYRAACKYGATILKPYYAREVETQTRMKFYKPTPEDILKFEKKYAKKLLNPDSKEFEQWKILKHKLEGRQTQPISKKETDQTVLYHGARMYRVDWKNFFARPKIKDFRKHTVIAELFTYNWYDVEQMVSSKVWDKQILDDLATAYGDDYMLRDYDFYTAIVQFDRNEDGVHERYLVTYEAKTKKIANAIYYPLKHIFYVPYCVFDRDDSWIGYSITEKMVDIAATANSVITSFVKEQDLAHTPIFTSTGEKAGDWTITLGQPNLLAVSNQGMPAGGSNAIQQYRLESVTTDRIAFLSWIIQYVSILTGVDPVLLSGSQDPSDKRAPAAKVGMKLQASTMRIEDMIITLQQGDAKVAEQVEDIVYRFPENPGATQIDFVKDGQKVTIDTEFFTRPVRYMCAGSRMAFDRNMDLQVIMATIDFLAKFYPEILQNLEAKKSLLNAVLNSSQGTVEKMKDGLLKPIDDMLKVAAAQQAQMQQFIQQKKAQGATDEQIQGFLRSMQRPAMPGGSAPAGAPPPQSAPHGKHPVMPKPPAHSQMKVI